MSAANVALRMQNRKCNSNSSCYVSVSQRLPYLEFTWTVNLSPNDNIVKLQHNLNLYAKLINKLIKNNYPCKVQMQWAEDECGKKRDHQALVRAKFAFYFIRCIYVPK